MKIEIELNFYFNTALRNEQVFKVNKRLSDVACNEEEYEKAQPVYETALNESGYKTTMTYTKATNVNKRNRARNIIWFNPP